MEFTSLDLVPDLQKSIAEAGFTTATPVQEAVFPHALSGEDIYAQSQTGTGKTAAFLVPIFNRILTVPELRTRKALVLAPTRELAVQIEGEAHKLAKYLPVSTACFYGGVGYGPQVDALRNGVQMMIGTPGRIIDLIQQGKMLLKEVGFLVIDEADRMFDMGFIDDLRRLIRYLPGPHERQTFLFSATLGLRVKDLAWEYMDVPKEITIEPEHMTVDLVTQELHHVGVHEKMRLLLGILQRDKPGSAIIFANQKSMVEEISRRLRINGVENEYIMGDLPQSKRSEIIDSLKSGRLSILVATDVAARGLDVEALDLVINYDLPDDTESYVHRIGRTARAGKAGKAVTFACEKFVFNLPSIEKFIGMKIPVAGWDPALQVEDKSEGMRFGRASQFRHEHGSRERERGQREEYRGVRRGAGGARNDDPRLEARMRDESRRPGEVKRRDDPRREGTPRSEVHGQAKGKQGPSRNAPRQGSEAKKPAPVSATPIADSGQDLYKLSQEERLRLFKEKYGVTPPMPGQKKAPEAAKAGKPAPRGKQTGQQPRGGKAAASPTPTPAPKKPGLIGRLLGLFGKKD
ncbi:MAG TPA: DEAD/DEAH box helicase [Rectinemataceae bacterium]|nr:DEAD/DEAH box helicase [Rectinemataceae bacterium]